jgi:hypothetical protein
VEVVRHEAVGVKLERFLLLQRGEHGEEGAIVGLVPERLLPAVTARDDVKEGTGEMDAGRPRHEASLKGTVPTVKPDTITSLAQHS